MPDLWLAILLGAGSAAIGWIHGYRTGNKWMLEILEGHLKFGRSFQTALDYERAVSRGERPDA